MWFAINFLYHKQCWKALHNIFLCLSNFFSFFMLSWWGVGRDKFLEGEFLSHRTVGVGEIKAVLACNGDTTSRPLWLFKAGLGS